ncbi:hypothetical protein G9A89_005683 [Geosiphon pyriformis]|nr:hypothetical protein G9A89_005683 [Geosiphon pyriformis]
MELEKKSESKIENTTPQTFLKYTRIRMIEILKVIKFFKPTENPQMNPGLESCNCMSWKEEYIKSAQLVATPSRKETRSAKRG